MGPGLVLRSAKVHAVFAVYVVFAVYAVFAVFFARFDDLRGLGTAPEDLGGPSLRRRSDVRHGSRSIVQRAGAIAPTVTGLAAAGAFSMGMPWIEPAGSSG